MMSNISNLLNTKRVFIEYNFAFKSITLHSLTIIKTRFQLFSFSTKYKFFSYLHEFTVCLVFALVQ